MSRFDWDELDRLEAAMPQMASLEKTVESIVKAVDKLVEIERTCNKLVEMTNVEDTLYVPHSTDENVVLEVPHVTARH